MGAAEVTELSGERAGPMDTGLSSGHKVWAAGPSLSCCLNKDFGIKSALALVVAWIVCRAGVHVFGKVRYEVFRQCGFCLPLRNGPHTPEGSQENRARQFDVKP